jgi:hypothetical protein
MAYTRELQRKVVTFDTFAAPIIGARFSKVTILGISDYTDVSTFQPKTRHNEVYGYLPVGSEKEYNRIDYIKVQGPNGDIMWFGESWINWETLVVHDGKDVVIRLANYPPAKLDFLRRMLANNNITDYELDISND